MSFDLSNWYHLGSVGLFVVYGFFVALEYWKDRR